MIAAIVKKEFLTNLVSPRFVIGFILCFVLIPFSILINISNYRDRTAQYRLDRDAAEKATTEVRVYSTLRPEVVLPPEPLSVFGKGLSDQVGNRARIWLGDKPFLAAGKTAAGDNPFLASFFSVDFVDIAAIIFSLLALIFSYDAFTREKEDGTLKPYKGCWRYALPDYPAKGVNLRGMTDFRIGYRAEARTGVVDGRWVDAWLARAAKG